MTPLIRRKLLLKLLLLLYSPLRLWSVDGDLVGWGRRVEGSRVEGFNTPVMCPRKHPTAEHAPMYSFIYSELEPLKGQMIHLIKLIK